MPFLDPKKFALSRRHLLRGMLYGGGAAVGLPLLEAMLDGNGEALADGSDLPTRFVVWFFGNGVLLDRFEPEGSGPTWAPSPQLQPLADAGVKDQVSVITGIRNRCEELISHHEGMTAFNGHTMAGIAGLTSYAGGPTIDQLVGDAIAQRVTLPVHSVHTGISWRTSIMDGGTTMHALSHRYNPKGSSAQARDVPNYPLFNPQSVWNRLFSNFVPRPDDRALRTSILDAVHADAQRLRQRLGVNDRARLDAHLDSVAALQTKIDATPPVCELPQMPAETNNVGESGPEPLTSVNQAMSDLIAYAFRCDITRVATVMFVGGAAETRLSEIHQTSAHHLNTHDFSVQMSRVDPGVTYIMERFGEFLQTLQAYEEPDGNSLLDSSIVYCSSDCSEGYSHSVRRQPILLAGHGRGHLVHPGIHVQVSPNLAPQPGWKESDSGNMSDVLLSVLQCFDSGATEIGSGAPRSTTPMMDIRA